MPLRVKELAEGLRLEGIGTILRGLQSCHAESAKHHVLDPDELRPKLKQPVLYEDLESGETIEVSPDFLTHEYRAKIDGHVADLKSRAQGAGLDYFLVDTSRPLDEALREYLAIRRGKL